MALMKDIRMNDGVHCNYHMIATVGFESNQKISILVTSYVDEESRNYMKRYAEGTIETPEFPYRKSLYFNYDWVESINNFNGSPIEDAYNYLKTLPEFEGALDV